jgi:hypothetical protein
MEKLTFDEVRSLNRPLVARASASYSWGIPEWDNLWKCVQHSVDNGRKKTFPLSTLILEFKPWPPASSDGYFLVLEGAPYIITIFLVHAVFLDLTALEIFRYRSRLSGGRCLSNEARISFETTRTWG